MKNEPIKIPGPAQQEILIKRATFIKARDNYNNFLNGMAAGLGLEGQFAFDARTMTLIKQDAKPGAPGPENQKKTQRKIPYPYKTKKKDKK